MSQFSKKGGDMSTYLIDNSFGLSPASIAMLNQACENFIRDSHIFDEIAVVEISAERHLVHVYDYSNRDLANLEPMHAREVEILLPLIDNLTVDEWSYISTATGSDFDVIYKMTPKLFLLINNTEMSIQEIQQQWCQNSFDKIREQIDDFVRSILIIIKGAVACE